MLAFEVPDGVDRPTAKQALIARLAEVGEYAGERGASSELREVTDPIMQAIDRHRGRVA